MTTNHDQGRPRFTTEADVMRELERLHWLSLDKVQEFQGRAVQAAHAEAEHKALRAKRILLAKAQGTRSISEAEYQAEADPDVATAYTHRLVATAEAEAVREAMRSIRTNQEALRTMAASRRDPTIGDRPVQENRR